MQLVQPFLIFTLVSLSECQIGSATCRKQTWFHPTKPCTTKTKASILMWEYSNHGLSLYFRTSKFLQMRGWAGWTGESDI